MKTVVLGAGGGLGRNVVDAAVQAGHEVRAFVRQVRGDFPSKVQVIEGDARQGGQVANALRGMDVAYFCLNPRFTRWLEDFPPLLINAIEAARDTGVCLVFPANVWVYGPGRKGKTVDESVPPSPTSRRGKLRAAMEQTLRESGCRFRMVRLPEFYGPQVVTLTALVFQAALKGKRTYWPGPLDEEVEFVYMPDAAEAMVQVGSAQGNDGDEFHVPGIRTTPRQFIDAVYRAARTTPRVFAVPRFALMLAGLVNGTAHAAADIAHLWTQPILLDGSRYINRFGYLPQMPYADGIAQTLAWHRGTKDLVLQG